MLRTPNRAAVAGFAVPARRRLRSDESRHRVLLLARSLASRPWARDQSGRVANAPRSRSPIPPDVNTVTVGLQFRQ
jgi:hypothetical protein